MLRVVAVVVVLLVYVYGLVDVIRTDRRETRAISKTAWFLVVFLLPILGTVLWFLLGRAYANRSYAQPVSHTTAPDDDPEFLRNLEARRRNQAEAERLKKLKAELDAKERKLKDGKNAEDSGDVSN